VRRNTHFNVIGAGATFFECWLDGSTKTGKPLVPVLDLISVPATNAYSCYRKLRTAYAGSAFRVRRDDLAVQDIGFVGNLVDTAALLTFVGAGSGFVTILYDQSGNGRDLAQATVANQPRIVNAGVLEAFPSGRIAMSFDGVNDKLSRIVAGNSTGITGSPNVTAGSVLQVITATCTPWWFGVNSAARAVGMDRFAGAVGSVRKTHVGTDRRYTLITAMDTAGHGYVLQHTAGDTSQTGTVRQNGTALAPGATGGSALVLNVADNAIEIGSYSGGASPMQGKLNCHLLFNAVLAGADLAALETELAAHV